MSGRIQSPVLNQEALPRILVIEHDTWVRTNLVAQLAAAGYQVVEASNGFTGLRLARDMLPNLIVIGAELPDVSAGEVRDQLNDYPRTRHVPVVPLISEPVNVAGIVVPEIQGVFDRRVV